VKSQRFESKCSPTLYLVPSPKSRFCTIQNRARGLVRIKLRSHNSFLLNARKGKISLICLAKKCNQTSWFLFRPCKLKMLWDLNNSKRPFKRSLLYVNCW
jgi:hypothetical protein